MTVAEQLSACFGHLQKKALTPSSKIPLRIEFVLIADLSKDTEQIYTCSVRIREYDV